LSSKVVKQGVDVVEHVFFGDRVVGVVVAELDDGRVFQMGEGEALALTAAGGFVRNCVGRLNREWHLAVRSYTD
jgi:hypothetical protein